MRFQNCVDVSGFDRRLLKLNNMGKRRKNALVELDSSDSDSGSNIESVSTFQWIIFTKGVVYNNFEK